MILNDWLLLFLRWNARFIACRAARNMDIELGELPSKFLRI